jgi:hypothetical protein
MSGPSGSAPPRSSRRGRWIVLVLALLGGPLLAEGGLRFLLFSDAELARSMGEDLRVARLYADFHLEDEFWQLRRRLGSSADLPEPPYFHPELGWITGKLDPLTLDHDQHGQVAGRRPVLLYGASFALPEFALLVEASDRSDEYALLHYGVGGYGIGQTYLLLRGSLDLYAGEDPVVLLGLKADDDFERCILSARPWPKPRLRIGEEGELVLAEPRVQECAAYFDTHPVGIRSYAWRYLLHGVSLFPEDLRGRLSGLAERRRECRELIAAIVRAIDAEVTSRGLRCAYVLFCGLGTAQGGEVGLERERFIVDLLDREGIPYVLVRPALLAAAEKHGERVEDYYAPPGHPRAGHPSRLGAIRTFPSLWRAMLGERDGR